MMYGEFLLYVGPPPTTVMNSFQCFLLSFHWYMYHSPFVSVMLLPSCWDCLVRCSLRGGFPSPWLACWLPVLQLSRNKGVHYKKHNRTVETYMTADLDRYLEMVSGLPSSI